MAMMSQGNPFLQQMMASAGAPVQPDQAEPTDGKKKKGGKAATVV